MTTATHHDQGATPRVPKRDDLTAAAAWLTGRVVRTPVVRSRQLDDRAGVRLWLKAENLQHTGSYKYRGALWAVSRVAREGRHRGVVAQSTGNHAIAVAAAARAHDLAATVVLPADAPAVKVDRVRAEGAQVVAGGATVAERLEVVRRLADTQGLAVIDAYDHPDVIAGQGTTTLELLAQVAEQGGRLDAVVLPVGGGGGIAGACLAVAGQEVDVIGVEPVGCDALARSLEAGRRVTVDPAPTVADGLRPTQVGELAYALAAGAVTEVVRVADSEILDALALALTDIRLILEPSAAAGIAAALRIAATGAYRDIGVVLTGGNVEPTVLAEVAAGIAASTRRGDG